MPQEIFLGRHKTEEDFMNKELFDFIDNSPTPFHAVDNIAKKLCENGYTHLSESEKWDLRPGCGYFVTRNMSSIIAFSIPSADYAGFMLSASHCDSPAYKIKDNAELRDGTYLRLSTEGYGGMICSTWLDRPLSVAGRVTVRTPDGIRAKLVDFKGFTAVIPNLAIHFNRQMNEGVSYNQAVDMVPLFDDEGNGKSFRERLAELAGVPEKDILSTDLIIYNAEKGCEWNSYISSPRLDDLQCAFATLEGFLSAEPVSSVPVYCCFDNEEVGSHTKQGAASTFLEDTLKRISGSFGKTETEHRIAVSNSMMLSCDNAHALHPNHPEKHDRNHSVYMNKGIVIKYNASQKYTSDSISSGLFQVICEKAGVPFQKFTNRADIAGGSTLGNIANTHVSLNTVDIGLPQLAMHSAYETAGAKDTEYMARALRIFFQSSLTMESDGTYTIK